MRQDIEKLEKAIEELIIKTVDELESYRLKYLSKKGIINDFFTKFKELPSDQKRELGKPLNILKQKAQEKYTTLKNGLENSSHQDSKDDLTKPPVPITISGLNFLIILNEFQRLLNTLKGNTKFFKDSLR